MIIGGYSLPKDLKEYLNQKKIIKIKNIYVYILLFIYFLTWTKMNGSLFPGIPLNPQINYGRAILFAPGNPQVPEQKTIRIVGQQQQQQHYLPKRPQEMLEPTVRIHTRRPTPYERPVKNELNKPLRITKRVTTTVEIDNPKGYISQDLLERALGITN